MPGSPTTKQCEIARLLRAVGMHREAEQALRTDLRARLRRARRRLRVRLIRSSRRLRRRVRV
ncbi:MULTISPECIES: hypothetical protein [unclassified Amycolatopsis]|uniref:hypothetical protein n=1 Tax=unclassified Amycolatopsis TaxID=2618356 RepID=UPI002E14F893|nr:MULTISPECIES: hypothetical protein [unclassified Amycolatopsis]WSK79818.1 hypothetical protein OG570_04295 [Amycolatopsis sp. NBC_01286]